MRLFVAVDLPEQIKTEIEKRCTGLPEVRWVKAAQMHLTLRFIGEADKGRVDAALRKITFTPFEMAVEGVGQFPPKRTPRVLWVGLTKPDALVTLARDVEAAITSIGFPPEDKPFSPHVTLARLKFAPPADVLQRFFERNAGFRTEPFTVNQFVLYSSVLSPGGSVYKKEAVYER